jgi:hypothetical protein
MQNRKTEHMLFESDGVLYQHFWIPVVIAILLVCCRLQQPDGAHRGDAAWHVEAPHGRLHVRWWSTTRTAPTSRPSRSTSVVNSHGSTWSKDLMTCAAGQVAVAVAETHTCVVALLLLGWDIVALAWEGRRASGAHTRPCVAPNMVCGYQEKEISSQKILSFHHNRAHTQDAQCIHITHELKLLLSSASKLPRFSMYFLA